MRNTSFREATLRFSKTGGVFSNSANQCIAKLVDDWLICCINTSKTPKIYWKLRINWKLCVLKNLCAKNFRNYFWLRSDFFNKKKWPPLPQRPLSLLQLQKWLQAQKRNVLPAVLKRPKPHPIIRPTVIWSSGRFWLWRNQRGLRVRRYSNMLWRISTSVEMPRYQCEFILIFFRQLKRVSLYMINAVSTNTVNTLCTVSTLSKS